MASFSAFFIRLTKYHAYLSLYQFCVRRILKLDSPVIHPDI
ncbi:hypothetical protein IMCC14465_06720 [alpha proteobacterium IMCC14465]|uniref:Uncharacterized protein n=1 Tax=alpha proteobacterium IMCC14465 TaxID=1220535 RepID=J9DG56_9PROT|nr:hypothetical protein IMCC14465_06720 [alpha proteobacterium IMCC14465]